MMLERRPHFRRGNWYRQTFRPKYLERQIPAFSFQPPDFESQQHLDSCALVAHFLSLRRLKPMFFRLSFLVWHFHNLVSGFEIVLCEIQSLIPFNYSQTLAVWSFLNRQKLCQIVLQKSYPTLLQVKTGIIANQPNVTRVATIDITFTVRFL